MSDISKIQNSKVGQDIDVSCRKCKVSTKHSILLDIQLNGNENREYFWSDEYQIVQCKGCETISFRKTHMNSEDGHMIDSNNFEETVYVDIYPNPQKGRDFIEGNFLLPAPLKQIYTETIKAINSNQAILTGIGIRAIVETVCKDKEANGRELYEKIDDLVKQGVLTRDGADILHKLRTLGNEAAHEAKPH